MARSAPKPEVYISVDVEANGPAPGLYSMLSFGCAAYTIEKRLVGTFGRNLELLPGAAEDPRTMAWWSADDERRAAYAATRTDLRPATEAMRELEAWCVALTQHGRPVMVGAPAGFDFTFVYWYLVYALRRVPTVGFAAIDLKSFAFAALGSRYTRLGKSSYKSDWFDAFPHTHVALDDALEQGALFINMLREHRGLERVVGIAESPSPPPATSPSPAAFPADRG